MLLPELRLLQSAIILAEELHFSRAAERLHIDQSTLSKRILELEGQLGFRLFERNHQTVEMTEPGRKFVEEAREAILHVERAVSSATAAFRGTDDVLNVGKSAYTDPYLVSIVSAIRLPLFPRLRIKLWSNYSHELARELAVGKLDLALITGIPDNPKLSYLKLAEGPFYIAMSSDDALAGQREVQLQDLRNRDWVLFSPHVGPYLYEMVQREASESGIRASDIHHFSTPEEAVPLILEHEGLAFLNRTSAWRIARDGITMRPLAQANLRVVTNLAVRVESKSRLVNEFVKATARKLVNLQKTIQQRLDLTV